MALEVTQVDTCTCPWCTAPTAAPFIPEIAGGTPHPLLPPPMPPTNAYDGADWTTAPPVAGTDDTMVAAAAVTPLVGTPAPTIVATTPRPVEVIPANVGTPFADAIGFDNPFLDAGPTDELPVHDARIDPTT